MKLWQGFILLTLLLAIMPLTACEYLGWGGQQQISEEQIKAYQEYNQRVREYQEQQQEQQQEYRRQVAEAYNKQLTEAYKEYSETLEEYYEERQKAIEEAITEGAK